MNIQQRQAIFNLIENYNGQDLAKKLAEKYTNETDLKKVSIGGYTVFDYTTYLNRVYSQFEIRLNKELWNLLPATQNFHNDFGDCDVIRDLTVIVQLITNSDFDNTLNPMEKLIYYEKINGFWDLNGLNENNVNEFAKKVIEQKAIIDLQLKQTLEYAKKIVDLTTEVSNLKSGLIEFQDQKISELNEVVKNVEVSRVQLTELTENLNKAKVSDTEISGILNSQKEKLAETTNSLSAILSEFEKFKVESETQKVELKAEVDKSKVAAEESKQLYDFVLGKKGEISRLTGMAADGSLGSKFHEKETRLANKFWIWQIAVPLITIISAAWVVLVFKFLYTNLETKWIEIILNAGKTAPVFILLGWVLRQYNKERILQEEYAFKSAVAMTITAYGDLLNDTATIDKLTPKQKMLLNSIKQVHTPPKLHSEKENSTFVLNSKELNETIKNFKEVVDKKID